VIRYLNQFFARRERRGSGVESGATSRSFPKVQGLPTVSIITPTRDRPHCLKRLCSCVLEQDWPNIEWLILDDSRRASPDFDNQTDERFHYFHETTKRSLGMKRNELVRRSAGEIVVHFDDDDFYASSYVSNAVNSLVSEGADIRKLVGLFIYDDRFKKLFYWDQEGKPQWQFICKSDLPLGTRMFDKIVEQRAERHRLGYGFSYVYKRTLWEKVQFPDVEFAEDLEFMKSALALGCYSHFAHDTTGVCVHIIHGANLSGCFPQYVLPDFLLESIFPRFGPYLHN
jgi:glycosyltransferase involved in cell wall biosynthesis